ncbi:MAG: hypothetical protein MJB14_02165 [Spirochaetes bacterium]|nr:hypothetical protein [Spirochaetota bacterium]
MKDNAPKKMTAGQLIEHLNRFPQDMRVVTHGQKEGYENLLVPEKITVYRNELAMSEYEGEYDTRFKTDDGPYEVVALFRDDRRD